MSAEPCRCDSGRDFQRCCAPLLSGTRRAATALALMRSRYVAYCLGDEAYLLATWHPDYRPSTVGIDPETRFTGLRILATESGKAWDSRGTVSFEASWVRGGRRGTLAELSSFVLEDGGWYYTIGVPPQQP